MSNTEKPPPEVDCTGHTEPNSGLVLGSGMASGEEKTSNSEGPPRRELPRDIYERLVPELMELPATTLIAVNLDVTSAVTTGFGVLPKIALLRESMLSTLGDFDVQQFDKLGDYARALLHSHAALLSTLRPPDGVDATVKQCTALRHILLLDVSTLVRRGLINEAHLKQFSRRRGYAQLFSDLLQLTTLLGKHWPEIKGHCGATLEDLGKAEQLASTLATLMGRRRHKNKSVVEAAEMRTRAFTAFTRAYSNIRRAVVYLRWHAGDADSIMPSLYKGHGGRGHKREDAATRSQDSTVAPLAPPGTSRATVAPVNDPSGSTAPLPMLERPSTSGPVPIAALANKRENGPFMS